MLRARSRALKVVNGYNVYVSAEEDKAFLPEKTAVVVCDMWDRHWCKGANERAAEIAPRMNRALGRLRDMGFFIVHAPSDTMDAYEGTPARERLKNTPRVAPPPPVKFDRPPMPVDASDEGSDTPGDTPHRAWSRQMDALAIDVARDGISDNGDEIYSYFKNHGIDTMLLMGVHTNMCIIGRSFALAAMRERGVDVYLARDLTDCMYNPARAPYVPHEEGTRLVVQYIETFIARTVDLSGLYA